MERGREWGLDHPPLNEMMERDGGKNVRESQCLHPRHRHSHLSEVECQSSHSLGSQVPKKGVNTGLCMQSGERTLPPELG